MQGDRHRRQRGGAGGAVGRLKRRPTIRKTRVLSLGQQLLRLDREETAPIADELSAPAIDRLVAGPRPGALVIADYGKGFLTRSTIHRLIAAARELEVPVLVDPIGRDFAIYRHATLIKPNLKELEEAQGRSLRGASEEELVAAARKLFVAEGLEVVVLTLGERGMLVISADGEAAHIPSRPREVYDVTGAGDTTIAVLALGLAVGGSPVAAARIANAAAGLVISEVGTASVELDALTAELQSRGTSKAYSWLALGEQVAAWRRQERRIVFTNGCFDLLHAGHLSLLNQAADQGDVLVVGINSDASVKRLKGPQRPLVSEQERVAMLAALQFVDAVTIFEEDTPLALIKHVKPDVLVKGDDYRIEDVVGRKEVESRGGEVKLVRLLPEYSTTALIDRIRQQ